MQIEPEELSPTVVSPGSDATRVLLDSIRRAGWAPMGVFLVHVTLSLAFEAYKKWPPLDIPMHFAGGVAMAYFLRAVVTHARATAHIGTLRPAGTFLLVIGLTGVVAIQWEYVEWIANAAFGAHIHMSLDDSLADLLYGLGGAAALLVMPSPPLRDS